jgi:Starch-binding associating with outer membrane
MRKINYIFLSFFCLILSSCSSSFFDVNKNPDAATEVDVENLIPTIFANLASNGTMENIPGIQVITQIQSSCGVASVFSDPEAGTLSNLTVRNTWNSFYGTGLRNLVIAEQQLTENLIPRNKNIRAQVKLLKAYCFYQLTTIYEDVPFTEAVKAEFSAPNFDTQQEVLEGILDIINEALAEIDVTKPALNTSGDLLFAGSLDKWIRFANSMKLQTLMLLVNKEASYVNQITAMQDAPMIVENSQNANIPFFNNTGNNNNVFRLLELFGDNGANVYFFASSVFLDILNDLNDPRRTTFFVAGAKAGGVLVGNDPTVVQPDEGAVADGTIARVREDVHYKKDSPFQIISASEIRLLRAECFAKGYFTGGLAAAETELKAGVRVNLDYWNNTNGAISNANKDAYLAQAIFDIDAGSESTAIATIQLQQYIDSFNRTHAWTNWKRTKIPALTPGVNSVVNTILRRYPIADLELLTNPNAPASKQVTVPMWYEK